MMRIFVVAAAMAALTVTAVSAQQPGRRQRQLQQQVVQRLMQNFRAQAGLTDQEYEQFREVITRSFTQRTEIQLRERSLWLALDGQMRPGVAADADSLTRIMDSLVDVQSELVELQRRDQQEYAEFLTPVQRAQLMLTTRRLQNNIQGIMQRRGQPAIRRGG
jgi:hypothetical protein